ncbi:DNA-processing protein DprA [Desulfotomaculum defluvii]
MADREELIERTGLPMKFIEALLISRSLVKAKKIKESLSRYNIRLLTINNELYPKEASTFPSSPVVLYYRGNLKEESMGIAIIGSRRCTQYGKQVTSETAAYLAEKGIPVISGMAKGIDGYAHTSCLGAGGYTIAFLANGLDICYPPEHQILMNKVIENGAVISPYPPQTRPLKANFYKRNELMSAWSMKVLVVEAGIKSGALMTAQFARQQNREILAVPNSIYSTESAGTNRLISQGAKIYLQPEQLLPEGLEIANTPLSKSKTLINSHGQHSSRQLTSLEKLIIERLTTPQDIEHLVDIFDGNMTALLDLLCIMELEGKINILQGKIVREVGARY